MTKYRATKQEDLYQALRMTFLYDTRLDASRRSLYERLKQLPPGQYTVVIEKIEKYEKT